MLQQYAKGRDWLRLKWIFQHSSSHWGITATFCSDITRLASEKQSHQWKQTHVVHMEVYPHYDQGLNVTVNSVTKSSFRIIPDKAVRPDRILGHAVKACNGQLVNAVTDIFNLSLD